MLHQTLFRPVSSISLSTSRLSLRNRLNLRQAWPISSQSIVIVFLQASPSSSPPVIHWSSRASVMSQFFIQQEPALHQAWSSPAAEKLLSLRLRNTPADFGSLTTRNRTTSINQEPLPPSDVRLTQSDRLELPHHTWLNHHLTSPLNQHASPHT